LNLQSSLLSVFLSWMNFVNPSNCLKNPIQTLVVSLTSICLNVLICNVMDMVRLCINRHKRTNIYFRIV
jgi:hypothetical protein